MDGAMTGFGTLVRVLLSVAVLLSALSDVIECEIVETGGTAFCQQHVLSRGYKCDEHKVYTDDGFILLLHRVGVRQPSSPGEGGAPSSFIAHPSDLKLAVGSRKNDERDVPFVPLGFPLEYDPDVPFLSLKGAMKFEPDVPFKSFENSDETFATGFATFLDDYPTPKVPYEVFGLSDQQTVAREVESWLIGDAEDSPENLPLSLPPFFAVPTIGSSESTPKSSVVSSVLAPQSSQLLPPSTSEEAPGSHNKIMTPVPSPVASRSIPSSRQSPVTGVSPELSSHTPVTAQSPVAWNPINERPIPEASTPLRTPTSRTPDSESAESLPPSTRALSPTQLTPSSFSPQYSPGSFFPSPARTDNPTGNPSSEISTPPSPDIIPASSLEQPPSPVIPWAFPPIAVPLSTPTAWPEGPASAASSARDMVPASSPEQPPSPVVPWTFQAPIAVPLSTSTAWPEGPASATSSVPDMVPASSPEQPPSPVVPWTFQVPIAMPLSNSTAWPDGPASAVSSAPDMVPASSPEQTPSPVVPWTFPPVAVPLSTPTAWPDVPASAANTAPPLMDVPVVPIMMVPASEQTSHDDSPAFISTPSYWFPTPAHFPSPAVAPPTPQIFPQASVPTAGNSPISGILGNGDSVLLMHPELLNGDCWFKQVDEQDLSLPLPFVLADDAFDVWIGHERATFWGHDHVALDSSNPAYWNWTWDEHAQYDLPAILRYIGSQTQRKVHLVGVSQSAAVGAAAATLPAVASLMKSLTLIGPTIFRGNNANTPLLRMWVGAFAEAFDLPNFGTISGQLNISRQFDLQYLSLRGLVSVISGPDCCISSKVNLFDNGWDGTTSLRNLKHFEQGMLLDTFQQYDFGSSYGNLQAYGEPAPQSYLLSNIPVNLPVMVVFGGQDYLSPPDGIQELLSMMQKRPATVELPLYAHLDLLFSSQRYEDVYLPIHAFLEANSGVLQADGW